MIESFWTLQRPPPPLFAPQKEVTSHPDGPIFFRFFFRQDVGIGKKKNEVRKKNVQRLEMTTTTTATTMTMGATTTTTTMTTTTTTTSTTTTMAMSTTMTFARQEVSVWASERLGEESQKMKRNLISQNKTFYLKSVLRRLLTLKCSEPLTPPSRLKCHCYKILLIHRLGKHDGIFLRCHHFHILIFTLSSKTAVEAT